MPRVSAYVTAPYQGISQAPPQVRLLEQAEDIQDAMLSLAEGATKRPPLTYLGKLEDHPGSTDGLFFMATRPETEGDVIGTATLEAGHIVPRVYKLADLTQLPVDRSDTDAQAYLDSGITTPADSLRSLTVEDFTFLTNRKVTVEKSGDTAPARPFEAMLWVRQGAYGREYEVIVRVGGVDKSTVKYRTPNGSDVADTEYVDTDTISQYLYYGTTDTAPVPDGGSVTGAGLSADLTALGFTVTRNGTVIYISHPTDDFTFFVKDGQDGTALVLVKGTVQNFSDLPKLAPRDFTVRITQDTSATEDDFFVKFVPSAGGTTGTWQECIAPGAELGYDPHLLPVALINDPDLPGWRIKKNPWLPREVGDQTLNPDPDFVGAVVEDMTYWKGRLAVLSREGITLSGSDNPFRLYPKTLATELDDDPLGFLSPFPDVSLLRYGIPFDERLVGFGDKCQVKLETAEKAVKPGSTDIDLLQTYEFSQKLRPQGANGKVYFAAPKGNTAAAIYELSVDSEVTNKTSAEDLTLAIPKLIPAEIDRVANCPVSSLLIYGVSGGTKLYPHIVRFANGQRVQNATNVWNLPAGFTLGGMFFKNTTLYLLLSDGSAGHVVTMDMAPNTKDDGEGAVILTHLDLRIKSEDVTLAYSSTFDQTVVTLPYPAGDNPKASVRAPGGTGGLGQVSGGLIPVTEGFAPQVIASHSTDELTPYQFVLNGKWDACPLWLGLSYAMRIKPTRIYYFSKDSRPMRGGRLQLAKLLVDLADTGYLRAEVSPRGRATRSYVYEGYRLDDPNSIYNAPPNSTTILTVPIRSENEQAEIVFVNDSHFGCKMLGFEWFGDYNPKAVRVT